MRNSKRLLLIGWDAADWKIIDPLMASGQMPNTRRLVEGGVRGNLSTLRPVLSPMLWTSIATGKRPFKHGIYGFSEPSPDRQAVQPMTNVSRRCKAIWNILNQQGLRSVVVGWWPSHPAEPIHGAMVSDAYHKAPRVPGQPWKLTPSAIHPPRCFDDLVELRLHPTDLTAEDVLFFVPQAAEVDQKADARLSVCMRMICECTTIHGAATHLMETEPWDFAAVYYDAIDHFSHGFMKFRPPRQEHIEEQEFKLYQNVVTAGYMYHDMMLGRLVELAGDDTTILLLSDHGFHPDHLRPRLLPAEPAGPAHEHRDLGIFVMHGPGIRPGHVVDGASLLDITPTVLSAYGLPIGEDMDGKPLLDVFEDERAVETISSWEDVEGDDGQHPPGFQMDASESKEALEQLIALGYIDRPDDDSEKAVAECTRELDYNLARAYMDAELFGEAIPLLAELYRRFPLEFRFGVQLANCLRAMGMVDDLARLIDDLNGRWRITRKEARARVKEVAKIARTRREQWNELQKIDEANRDDPSNPPRLARTTPGGKPVLFTDAEQQDIRKLRAIVRGNPQTLDFLAAAVATERGDAKGALELLRRVEGRDAENPMFLYHLGNACLALQQWEDAERAYARVLELDAFHADGSLGLCRTCLETGDYDRALEYGNRSVKLKFHAPAAHYFLAGARERTGDVDGAIASFLTAIEQNPNFPEAHEHLARLYSSFSARFDESSAKAHAEAAEALRAEAAVVHEARAPLELPTAGTDDIREQLPEIKPEQSVNSDLFLRCLAQAPETPSEDPTERPTVTIVSGLPRSGTSMMMQMLVAGGVEPYVDGERTADESNPKGYFESEQVKKLAHENFWLRECDGRVVKVVAQLIPYLPQHVDYRIIFMDREMAEVVESQDRMLERLDRTGGKLEHDRLAEVFQQQTRFAFTLVRAHGVPVLKVAYADVIGDPAATARAVSEFLGADLDQAAMASVVDPALYRERHRPGT